MYGPTRGRQRSRRTGRDAVREGGICWPAWIFFGMVVEAGSRAVSV